MTHLEALVALADRPHLWRFRELCADDSDPERRDAYRSLVVRMARGEIPPPAPAPARPSVAESLRLAGAMNACPYRSTEGCGCGGARCALRAGRTVAHPDCFECLGRYG